jgi:hypothetical protein
MSHLRETAKPGDLRGVRILVVESTIARFWPLRRHQSVGVSRIGGLDRAPAHAFSLDERSQRVGSEFVPAADACTAAERKNWINSEARARDSHPGRLNHGILWSTHRAHR